jgi:hypothetical protein
MCVVPSWSEKVLFTFYTAQGAVWLESMWPSSTAQLRLHSTLLLATVKRAFVDWFQLSNDAFGKGVEASIAGVQDQARPMLSRVDVSCHKPPTSIVQLLVTPRPSELAVAYRLADCETLPVQYNVDRFLVMLVCPV